MNYRKPVFALLFVGMFVIFSSVNAFSQETMKKDEMMKKDDAMMMKKDDKRPIVAVVKADWCPYCKRIEPTISKLMTDYSPKMNFVVFDVTNETTTAESMKMANKLGLGDFFRENKGKTSTVAVLVNKKITYKTSNNSKRGDYVEAFDKALK